MKKFRKIASLAITAAMMTSSLAFAFTANAVTTDSDTDSTVSSSDSSVDYGLQDNVQDGVILHAFNWSYNSIKENLAAIAAAGYSTVQTSPAQQPKDYATSTDVSGQWWKLYQPVSFSIGEDTWLGTKAELTSLCEEAEKYGIKIIVDVVSNHMGNEDESDPNSLSTQVQTYQPDFYENKDTYFRSNSISADDSSIQAVVQGHVSSCPDLDTSNKDVQAAVVSYLKECIDCGVDGFRFDAAKHIETPYDGEYASDYWPTVTSEAGEYYYSQTGNELYIYGEILNTCGSGRSYSSYTQYINITDNVTGDTVLCNVYRNKTSLAATSTYNSGEDASDIVLWAESHDTYEGTSGSAGITNTANVPDSDVVKAWALVAARKDATALYFARPGSAKMGEAATDLTYKSTAVSEINKFHNLFVGQDEYVSYSDDIAYVVRGTSGIVLSNCNGDEASVSISGTGMADGSYIDTITGNVFTVEDGVLSGDIGSTGVAVVYEGTTTPKNTCSVESCDFEGETITVTIGLENAVSGTYSLNGSTPAEYTDTITIRIGSDYDYGETIELTLTATDGTNQTETVYSYTKNEAASTGIYVYLNAEKKASWNGPFYVYLYDEETEEAEGISYSNGNWPGQQMSYDEASGYYYLEVSDGTCLMKDGDGNTAETDTFDLAHSANTRVIVSSSNAQQYPSTTGYLLEGTSHILFETSTSSKKAWTTTDLVPTVVEEEATEVTRPAEEPTTEEPTAEEVTTEEPTTEEVTTEEITTAEPIYMLSGDVNGDNSIDITDVTLVQKASVKLATLNDTQALLADVNGDGRVSVLDATCIQKYVVGGYTNVGTTGEKVAVG